MSFELEATISWPLIEVTRYEKQKYQVTLWNLK